MRTKNALYNLIANLVLQLVTALCGFILPALFIRYYGSEINGLIGSIKEFMQYLSLVEGGVGVASIAALYTPLLNQSGSEINRILSATRAFYKKSGYLFLSLVVLIAVVYPWLVKDEVGIITSFLMVLILSSSGLMEYFFIGKYRVLLTADQKNYLISFILAASTAINTMVSIILILIKVNVLVVQVVSTFIYISGFFIIRYYVRKHYPQINFMGEPDFTAISQRWSAFIHQIAGIIVFNSPVVLITIFCSLKDVSIYLVYNMVFAAISQLIAIFSNGLMAGFGEIIASNKHDTLSNAYANYEYIFYGVLTWAYTCSSLLIMPFIKLYTSNFTDANYYQPIIAALFIISGIANNIRVPPNTIVNAAGHFRNTQMRAILEATINLTASLILVRYMGIAGVILGSVCSYAYRTLDFILYAAKYILKQSPLISIKRIIINALLAFISVLPFVFWITIITTTYLEWFIWAAGIAVFVFIIVAMGNALTDFKMFRATINRLKSITANKAKTEQIGSYE